MLTTNLHFTEILRWFENSSFECLMLLLPSSDPNDRKFDDYISHNQIIIDCLTGNKIAYVAYGDTKPSGRLTPVKEYPLSPGDIRTNVYISREVCRKFNLGLYNLPALFLISKNHEYCLYPISSETDLDSYFTPISIVTDFIEDYQRVVDHNRMQNELFEEIERAQLIKKREYIEKRRKHLIKYDIQGNLLTLRNIINTNYRQFLEQYGDLMEHLDRFRYLCEETRSMSNELEAISMKILDIEKEELMSNEGIRTILSRSSEKLNNALFVSNGAELLLSCLNDYSQGLMNILNSVKDKAANINRKLERIKKQIEERGFDIFISCKSEDYQKAKDVYDFLLENRYKPFLADQELREIGTDDYGCAIRQIIDKCHYMIVYASNVEYMTTTYVHSEWNQFLNSLNSGLIEGKLFSIISPSITAKLLPPGLSTRQFFTFDNYKEQLLQYIRQ